MRIFPSAFSVNSMLEQKLGIEEIIGDVRYVSTDLAQRVGKPVVLLDDILREANGSDPVGIVNADTYLAGDVSGAIERLHGTNFLAERRTDVETLGATEGTPYAHGFDFFVIPARLIPVISGSGLALGVPWWDHFVPVALTLAGNRPVGTGNGLAFSLVHDERWDSDLWETYGRVFVQVLVRRLSLRLFLQKDFRLFTWTLITSGILLGIAPRNKISKWALRRVARQNLSLVERFRRTTDT
jgi:hypothetical protein